MGWFDRILGSSDYGGQQRYSSLDEDGFPWDALSALTGTGLRVSVASALTIPGAAAPISVLAEDIAKVPLDLKVRTAQGWELAIDHPLFALLKQGPAPWLSSYAWRRTLAFNMLAHGAAFQRVHRDETGTVIQKITPIQAGTTVIRWADDGEPFFDVSTRGGIERGLSWQDVIYTPYRPSGQGAVNGGCVGVSPLLQHRETVALALATERFASHFFANGARLSGVLETDKTFANKDDAIVFRKDFEKIYSGTSNAGRVALLEFGLKWKEIAANPKDSQLAEIRKDHAVQFCSMYNVPPHKVGILDRATNNNIESQGIDYVTSAVSSLARNIETAIAVACLMPSEREKYKIEHNLEGLMRGDMLGRYRAYAIGRQWGWLSADDVLETENRNKLPGGIGEDYLVPLNMIPAGEEPPLDDEKNPDKDKVAHPLRMEFASRSPLKPKLNGHKPPRAVAGLVGARGESLYLN